MNLYHYVCTYKNTTIEGDVEADSIARGITKSELECCTAFREYYCLSREEPMMDWPDRTLKVAKTMESVL